MKKKIKIGSEGGMKEIYFLSKYKYFCDHLQIYT